MALGELLLSAFFQVLFDRLASTDLLNFARGLQGGVDSELEKWKDKFEMIQEGFSDAEEKQFTNNDVKTWLDDLRDWAYDAEDILDELAAEALKRKLTLNKVQNLFNAINPRTVNFNSSMQSKIKSATTRLEMLCRKRNELGLVPLTPGGTSSSTGAPQRPPGSSVPIEPVTNEREEDKDKTLEISSSVPTEHFTNRRKEDKGKILEMLLGDDKDKILEMLLSDAPTDGNVRVIAIVGKAGIGKTTLARAIYTDKAIQEFKFDVKAWVCVSDVYLGLTLFRSIIESITSKPCDLKTSFEEKQELAKAVDGKKVFLVIDDIHTVSNLRLWKNLTFPFLAAAPNSKILVTTRDTSVEPETGITYHLLKYRPEDICWALFRLYALKGTDINSHRLSNSFRNNVIGKCGGLPLAATVLGILLHSKRDGEWNDILNSNIFNIFEKDEIHPTLWLSYQYLPFYLKRCFAYCAIFPKDYEFEKNELVLLWMGEGIVQQSRNDDMRQGDWGSRFFDDLVSRSIFQQSKNDNSKYTMNYLFHELAQSVSKETTLRLEEANLQSRRFEEIEEANQQSRGFERIRHFSFSRDGCDGKSKFEDFNKIERLRTFLPILRRGGNSTSYLSHAVLHDLFLKFKKLRVLSLAGYHITRLPNSVEDLRLLRYLNLSGTMIKTLPESTSSLFNMQILILRNCSRLIKLPSLMRNLINLCYLDIKGANSLKEMPSGMKLLKNLQKLSNFILGKGENVSSLKDLKILKFLPGELCISGLENSNDSKDATEAELCEKQNLEALSLKWGSQFDNSRDEAAEESVLNMLKPHTNIKMLSIICYGGSSFSSWIGDQSFSKIEVLTLEDCENCESLPSISLLDSLKHLTIKGLLKLNIITSETLRSLETLHFENLLGWQRWDNDNVEVFPRLRKLCIVRCPKLSGKLPELLPSLEILVVNKCAELVVPISCFPKLCKLEIDGCKGMVCSRTVINSKLIKCVTISNGALEIYGYNGMLCNRSVELLEPMNILNFGNFLTREFQMVETLAIGDPQQIKSWRQDGVFQFKKPVQGLNILAFHSEVSIEKNSLCLPSFPKVKFPLNNVRYLKIENSKALISLPKEIMGNNSQLERLNVSHCDSLIFITKCKLPSSLKRLEISCCKKLERLVDEEVGASSSSSSFTLTHLEIFGCPELTTLLSGIQSLEALVKLKIDDCPKLWSLPNGLHNLNCLQWIYICNCPTLVSFPERGLPSTISDITICGCEELTALPDDMGKLNGLQHIEIHQCPRIVSFPVESFPSSLTSLEIGDQKFYEALISGGLNKLTSLTYLYIEGCHNAESFPDKETLPTSLVHLKISGFQKLKYISSMGFQTLTSLQRLEIYDCPKLQSFPEMGLPTSLLQLEMDNCPLLKIKCKRDKGKEWSKIAHIPCVVIDENFVYDP